MMIGAVFDETLRTKWRQILYWGGGMALMGLYATAAIPDVDALEKYADLLESMPSFLVEMVGGGDETFLATPEGWLSIEFFGWALLVFSAYGIVAGLNISANEEDSGVLDTLLSWPIPRWRVVAEKLLAYTVIITGMLVLSFAGLVIGALITPALNIGALKLAENTVNILPSTLFVVTFTACLTTLTRRKGVATGIATAFVIASYFIDAIGRAASDTLLAPLRSLSYFNYFANQEVMRRGLVLENVLLLAAVTAVLVGVSLLAFERRDIGL